MIDSQITIFYSWQSDLPGSETRNIIQESIKDVVKLLKDTVDIEADRDTKGEYGSPDIAQTIFSKIDACDIFIADVSAVCRYETIDKEGNKKIKYMPNPNVMLELGYATHVVGWDNVICVLNSDYGAPDDMPFDISGRRLTPFSLKEGNSKGEVKKYIKEIIRETVEHLIENGKRAKDGFSNLKLGCFTDGTISNEVSMVEISKSAAFIEHKKHLLDECQHLVKDISETIITEFSEELKEESNTCMKEKTPITTKDGTVLISTELPFKIDLFKLHKVSIKDDDREFIIERCKKYLAVDITQNEEFFNVGNLKVKSELGASSIYDGTEEEKRKYDSIIELDCKLGQLEMFNWYITTFDGLLFIPLAIENTSTVYDEAIDIHISVEDDEVEVVKPSEHLLNPEMQGLEGFIVENDIIKELLLMPESSEISYDSDITYSIADTQAQMRAQFSLAGINGNPEYNAYDYEREISKYIASPIEGSHSEYIFSISSLRAKDRKWIGPALLLRAKEEKFNISYTIKSKNSDGTLSGKIKI